MTTKANKLKLWVSYLGACERLIEQKRFQAPFVSYKIDKASKCIYLTLASIISSEILKTIKQCRQGDNINLYTIKPPKKYKLLSLVSHNLSFKEFYQQYYQGDSFFLLTDNIGAVIGYLPPKIIEEQSELRTSEKCLLELKQEIDFADFKRVSAKFESLNSQTHTLKVSLSEEYLELTSVSGIITNSLASDLHPIRVQKVGIKRLIEKCSCQPALDVFLFGQNKELKLSETSPLAPIPLYKHLNIDKLNEHQKLAIKMILASPDFFLLQGPPATGKSTVIVVLCSVIPLQGQKVLLSCQFNSAVDNIFSKLPKHQSILAVRLGEITKISEEVLEYFEKNAFKTWLKSVAEECDKNLQEIKKKFEQVDLFFNCWAKIVEWASWHKQSTELLAIAEKKKGIADKYQEAALEFKDRYLKTIKIEEGIKLLIQEFQTHQFTYESNSELSQLLTELKFDKVTPNLNQTESNLWDIATEMKQLILDIKPGGYIHDFKNDFAKLYRDIKLNIVNRQNSLKRTQEMRDKIEKIRFELKTQQDIVQNLKNILNHGIIDESSEVVSFSSTYTSICDRLNIFTNRNKSKKTITILIDAFKILRHQINFVQLIRSWEEAEINLLPNKINQHKYIYDKLLNLEKLSTLLFIGRLYKPVLYRAKEQLKTSLENIFNNVSHFYHAKTSDLAIKIHDEYNSELQIAEAKVIELTSQYQQEGINIQDEQRRYKKLLDDAQLCFGEANYLKKALDEVFEPFVDTIDLIEVENSLEIEELLKVNKNVISMAASIEEFIPIAENNIIQPFQNALLSVSETNLSSQNEYVLSEQSALDKAKSLNEEYNSIMSHIKYKDDKHKLGRSLWEELRTKKSVPEFCNKPIPDLELLNAEREPWLSSIGSENDIKRLETKMQIKEDWIAQIRSGNIEISDESYELFLKYANVVGATCIQAGNQKTFLNRFSEFDFTIIDEVSKATITEMLLPCLVSTKIVLAGDWKQLPPIFKDESYFIEAAQSLGVDADELKKELTTSLFKERYEYLEKIQASRTIMLINQYRMHSQIMSGVNPFYGNKLILGYSKQDSKRAHGISIPKLINSKHHLMWVDLPLDNSNWHHQQIGTGRQNPLEAELTFSIIMKMKNSFKKDVSKKKDIGIISVYKAQTDLIKSLYLQKQLDLPPNVTLTIGTVDEFQGMEKDIIFVNLVLNKPGVLPSEFLQTPERINVAISRAKSLLIITGSSHNYVELESEASSIYQHILDIAKKHKGYVPANKFMD